MAWPCPFSVKFSTPVPVQGVVQNDIMALPENQLGATSVVPGVKPVEGMLLPTPIRCVLGGKFHVLEMTMVPTGSSMVKGTVTAVVLLFQGVVPAAQVKAAVPLMPRASITAPVPG